MLFSIMLFSIVKPEQLMQQVVFLTVITLFRRLAAGGKHPFDSLPNE